ncbi:MAG: flagellar hook-length control protein FliK [Sedimenticola sp.]|nr:flagellar hook-length control protein FliK [Sedimenticola sp.]
MNSVMTGANLGPSLMSSSTGKGRSLASEISAEGLKPTDFNEILSEAVDLIEGVPGIEQLLTPDQMAAIRSLLANGNELPVSADIADGDLLGNPALLQLLTQLSGGDQATDTLTITDGSAKAPGEQLSLADLRALLLKPQVGGAKGEGVSAGQGGKPINPASLLVAKPEIPIEPQMLKPTLLSADISAALSQGNTSASSVPFSSLLSGLDQLPSQRSDSMNPPAITLPAGDKGWDNVLSNRIMWMVGKQMQQASLQITPRHLGPIDIQVSIHNDQTSVSFVAHNAVVKEALEAAIPRLREMFTDSNMQLVNVDVGQRETGSERSSADLFGQGDGAGKQLGSGHDLGSPDGMGIDSEPLRIVSGIGLVDDYA